MQKHVSLHVLFQLHWLCISIKTHVLLDYSYARATKLSAPRRDSNLYSSECLNTSYHSAYHPGPFRHRGLWMHCWCKKITAVINPSQTLLLVSHLIGFVSPSVVRCLYCSTQQPSGRQRNKSRTKINSPTVDKASLQCVYC